MRREIERVREKLRERERGVSSFDSMPLIVTVYISFRNIFQGLSSLRNATEFIFLYLSLPSVLFLSFSLSLTHGRNESREREREREKERETERMRKYRKMKQGSKLMKNVSRQEVGQKIA